MQGFDEVARELTQQGFRAVRIVEITHGPCGDFRGAVADVADVLPCPKCAQPAEAAILGRGLTRRPKIEWALTCPPLSPGGKGYREDAVPKWTPNGSGRRRCSKVYEQARREVAALGATAALETRILEAVEARAAQCMAFAEKTTTEFQERPKAKAKPRATRSEIALRTTVTAAMRMRGEGRIAIATTLGISGVSLKVMFCRRKAALSAEQARLSALSPDVRQSEEESARLQLGRNEPCARVARRWQLRPAKSTTSDALEKRIGATAAS